MHRYANHKKKIYNDTNNLQLWTEAVSGDKLIVIEWYYQILNENKQTRSMVFALQKELYKGGETKLVPWIFVASVCEKTIITIIL